MTKVSFSCLTSPIHPIFTHNDMKHAKMQDVKKVPNLASDFVCSGHIKTKVNGFSHSPTRDLEGRKKKNTPAKQKPPDQSNSYLGLSLHGL